MGTEVHCKSSFEGYYSMRDVNEDSYSSSWPLFYGENNNNNKGLTLTNNGQYYNSFIPRTVADSYPDKDALKQKMLEHESVFKNQVYELHRLYRRQRDMMEEIKRKEYHKHRISIDTSSSSSLLPSHEDSHKWKIPSLPLSKPSIFGAEISNSPLSCSKGNNNNNNNDNNIIIRDCEIMECRPSKVRKKLFDLELSPDENNEQVSEESSGQCGYRESNGLADLNEPVIVEEATGQGSQFLGPNHEIFDKSQNGRPGFNGVFLEGKGNGNGRDWLSNTRETGNFKSNMNFTPGNYPENSTRIQDQNRSLPLHISRTNSSYPYMNSTDLGNYWGKPNGSLTQKLTSFLPSPQTHTVFGEKWRPNGCYTPNGFYHGSSSGSKDPCARLPSNGFENRNCNNLDDRSQKIIKGSNFIDLTGTTKGIDLNNDNNISRKYDQTTFPWLQDKPKPIICKNDSRCDRVENGKILGFPVFGNSCVPKNDISSVMSTSTSLRVPENGKIKMEIEHRGFDINVAWEENDTEIEKIKNNFDLNSCLTEDEEFIAQESVKSLIGKVKKTTVEIDLEAPAVGELEEEETVYEVKKIDYFNDELLAELAAEAIVALTGQQDQVGSTSEVAVDRLLWLGDVIEEMGFVSNELDEYEELTLQLEETKEEDYMPKPLAPDLREPEEVGSGLIPGPTRPRRGQARRGRPRRDFQRDILPGLVSLSRHEVTEDLQIFGGLMKATGHSWNVGLTRRSGTRGRRKSVAAVVEPSPAATPPPPPPPPAVVGLEERSLTGWGKTTRRPRRQRCGSGSSVAVPLT